jgi:Uma2 family endonuclease
MPSVLSLPQRREWTVDDLADLPKDLNYELINGRLVLPSATGFHQELMGEVWIALRAKCPPEYFVSMDQSLKIDRRNEPRPDVVVIRAEEANRSPVPVESAVLAVEIISPGSTLRDTRDKAKVYARSGIGIYWIIDHLGPTITLAEMVLRPDGTYEPTFKTDEVVTVDRPWAVTLDLPAWTARQREVLERAKPAE